MGKPIVRFTAEHVSEWVIDSDFIFNFSLTRRDPVTEKPFPYEIERLNLLTLNLKAWLRLKGLAKRSHKYAQAMHLFGPATVFGHNLRALVFCDDLRLLWPVSKLVR